MIELLVNLPNLIPELQHAPLPLNCCKPRNAPQLLLLLLFTFGLIVKSIKELGSALIDGVHHYIYHKVAYDQHRPSFDIPNMDSQVEESKST